MKPKLPRAVQVCVEDQWLVSYTVEPTVYLQDQPGGGEGTSGLDPKLMAPSVNQVLVLRARRGRGPLSWGPIHVAPTPRLSSAGV